MNGETDDDAALFKWGNEYVRPTDPETSKDAAEELDVANDSWEAFRYFRAAWPDSLDGINGAEFEQYVDRVLVDHGWDKDKAFRRAESLRRRLTDLERKYRVIETRLNGNGKRRKRNERQIYYLLDAAEVPV